MESTTTPSTTPSNHTSPKDFFLHLISVITLYASAVSLGTVLFQIINISIPDIIQQYDYPDNSRRVLRDGLSFLIIMFPAYLTTLWFLKKGYDADETKRNARVKKWLIYFTLFVSILVIMFSLVSLINTFLNGELTLRFGLKVLSVLAISGLVLGYYILDIKKHKI
ncbi:MAG: DUF5671 domain-containing protein [Patescibacteria group bacterium]